MTRVVRLTLEAERDLDDARAWHETKRPGLGDDSLLCVESVVESIRRRPRAFAVVERGIRRALCRRFPYGVFYVADDDDEVVVIGVLHSARDPEAWRERR